MPRCEGLQPTHVAVGSGEAPEVAEAVLQQFRHDASPEESGRSGDENGILDADDGTHPSPSSARRHEWQDVEPIVLKLEEFLHHLLDAMPCAYPVLGRRSTEDRHAVHHDAGRAQRRSIYEGRSAAAKAR